jgi:hypothetical protein
VENEQQLEELKVAEKELDAIKEKLHATKELHAMADATVVVAAPAAEAESDVFADSCTAQNKNYAWPQLATAAPGRVAHVTAPGEGKATAAREGR